MHDADQYCDRTFNALNTSRNTQRVPDGLFFTNPYFQAGGADQGLENVRQLIKQEFTPVVVQQGKWRAADSCSSYYAIKARPGLENIELADMSLKN